LKYDNQFQQDIDHVCSGFYCFLMRILVKFLDMNACVVHLIGFFKAKWKLAFLRKLKGANDLPQFSEQENKLFEEEFEQILECWNLPQRVMSSLHRLCLPSGFSQDDGAIIRKFFHDVGVIALGINFSFVEGSGSYS
jgi:hypothetical protein